MAKKNKEEQIEKTKIDLSKVVEKINKVYGEGTAFKFTEAGLKHPPEWYLSSGSYEINRILSGNHNMGMLRGRIMEIYGPESSGKTTFALHFAAECTRRKMAVAFMDHEHALDDRYAKAIGVDFDYFFKITPICAEDSFEVTASLIKEGVKLFIYDSIPSMRARAEVEGTMDDKQMATHARVMGQGLKKCVDLYGKHGCWAIYINQLRFKIGVFFGNPETTPGGAAMRFYSSYRLDIRANRGNKIEETVKKKSLDELLGEKDEEDTEIDEKKKSSSEKIEIGNRTIVKTEKNKLYMPKRKVVVKIDFGKGIDKEDDTLQMLASMGIIGLNGAVSKKVNYGGKNYLRKKFIDLLKTSEFKKEIKIKINNYYESQKLLKEEVKDEED